jgi:hypothetical protein
MWLAALLTVAVVVQDQTPLRASPTQQASRQAVLWQGDWLEVRGEHKGYLKVWDHRHERPGYVRPTQVRTYALDESALPALRAVIAFVEDTPGAEALGIAHVALYLKAAPAAAITPDLFASLGHMADRLARRASVKRAGPAEAAIAAHLEVVATYGVELSAFEREDGIRLCYDGEAHQRVLAMRATPEHRARAALALSDLGCTDPNLTPMALEEVLRWRLAVLDLVPAAEAPPLWANRLRLRRASLRSQASFQAARRGDAKRASELGRGAWEDLARVETAELAEDDGKPLEEAQIRVAAAQWTWQPAVATSKSRGVELVPRAPGETCIRVRDLTSKAKPVLVERCTYAVVHAASVRVSPRGGAVAIAVQPLPGWVEALVFRQVGDGWITDPIVPTTTSPELGVVEVTGWSKDEKTVLVASKRPRGTPPTTGNALPVKVVAAR